MAWTDLPLENAPLDTKIDLEKDLKENNRVHAFIKTERMEQRRRREDQEQRERDLKNSIAEIRESLRPAAVAAHRAAEELLATDQQTQRRLHLDVIDARKQLKKANFSVERFRELEEEERTINSEVGKKKRNVSRISNRYATDFKKRLEDRGHGVISVMRDYRPQSSPFDLTVCTSDHRTYYA